MNRDVLIHVVDDDPVLNRSMRRLLEVEQLEAQSHPSAEQLLEQYDPDVPGCVLTDLRMPGMDGLRMLHEMRSRGWMTPVIFMSAYVEIRAAVDAVRFGAVDFVEKPFDGRQMIDRVHEALRMDEQIRLERAELCDLCQRLDRLTRREREVLDRVVDGRLSKQIALDLQISPRTVDVHRSRIAEKLGVESLPELVTLTLRCQQLSTHYPTVVAAAPWKRDLQPCAPSDCRTRADR